MKHKILPLIFLGLALVPVLLPNLFWHILMLADHYTSWNMSKSAWVWRYHQFLVSTLPDRPELPAPELSIEGITFEKLKAASNGFTRPVIMRGAADQAAAFPHFGNRSWWIENYGDEPVECRRIGGDHNDETIEVTIREALTSVLNKDNKNGGIYVAGENKIFHRRPELKQIVNSTILDEIAPGTRAVQQIFIGYPGMGTDVHNAIGVNFFRQITGRKKWWLIPPNQSPFVFAVVSPNGYSAHSITRVGKGNEEPSPWFK